MCLYKCPYSLYKTPNQHTRTRCHSITAALRHSILAALQDQYPRCARLHREQGSRGAGQTPKSKCTGPQQCHDTRRCTSPASSGNGAFQHVPKPLKKCCVVRGQTQIGTARILQPGRPQELDGGEVRKLRRLIHDEIRLAKLNLPYLKERLPFLHRLSQECMHQTLTETKRQRATGIERHRAVMF